MNEYKCERCNYSTKYAQNFKRHINSSKHKKKFVLNYGKKNMYVNVEKNINSYWTSKT